MEVPVTIPLTRTWVEVADTVNAASAYYAVNGYSSQTATNTPVEYAPKTASTPADADVGLIVSKGGVMTEKVLNGRVWARSASLTEDAVITVSR